ASDTHATPPTRSSLQRSAHLTTRWRRPCFKARASQSLSTRPCLKCYASVPCSHRRRKDEAWLQIYGVHRNRLHHRRRGRVRCRRQASAEVCRARVGGLGWSVCRLTRAREAERTEAGAVASKCRRNR